MENNSTPIHYKEWFKSPQADWRFLNNLLSSKNIPSDMDYWRGEGDKGRKKRLEISKKYFDENCKEDLKNYQAIRQLLLQDINAITNPAEKKVALRFVKNMHSSKFRHEKRP